VKVGRYQILIQGSLSPDWADWFEGMEIRQEAEGLTVLEGQIVDQAALHGILARLRDLNLCLISVNPSPARPGEAGAGAKEKGE
jgi:hypothetical protein